MMEKGEIGKMKELIRDYQRPLNDCVEEAKRTLNKRYATQNVKMLALKLWRDSSVLVEVEVNNHITETKFNSLKECLK